MNKVEAAIVIQRYIRKKKLQDWYKVMCKVSFLGDDPSGYVL